MNTSNRHPDTELLDRLRAGLLDQEPAHKAQLEAHLANCESCRRRTQRAAHLQPDAAVSQNLEHRLDQARQRAMQMPRRASLPRFVVPVAAAAAVALLAVILVDPLQQEAPSEPQLAESTGVEVPELYEELDFYLWLADHKARTGDSAT
jgi:predicted anti-sigma-YlaC factor YlaD